MSPNRCRAASSIRAGTVVVVVLAEKAKYFTTTDNRIVMTARTIVAVDAVHYRDFSATVELRYDPLCLLDE